MSRILVTGAAGRIGRTLRHGLAAAGFTFRSIDLTAVEDPFPDEECVTGDVSDVALMTEACRDVAAVVHLAAIPTEAPWEQIRQHNIEATYAAFEAARIAGVPRVVFASSIHASGFSRRVERLGVEEVPKPDTLYGVSKVFGESLGRMYADRHGMQVACVRIGAFQDRPQDGHSRSIWLSPGDAVRLFHALLTSPDLGYAVLWGVSANGTGWLDLEPARRLGYPPHDDAEQVTQAWADGPDDPLGGWLTGRDADPEVVAERWARRCAH
ncbi:MAG: NAD-dependent epimerase/dehydratase family protein [Mycobacteriales bacterium]